MKKIKKGLGKRIQQIREENKLSQAVFSDQMGISQGHNSAIESGARNPSGSLIRLISLTFDVDLEWILSG